MTARRPSKIQGDIPPASPRDEDRLRRLLQDDPNEDDFEGEAAGDLQETANAQLLRSARDLSDDAVTPVIHPALTDFGPESAATLLGQGSTHHQPTLISPPAPRRTGRRARTRRASPSGPVNSFNDGLAPDWKCPALSEEPDDLEYSDPESKVVSQTRVPSADPRKPRRSNSEDLLGRDDSQVPLRRKAPKRARRTSNIHPFNNEEHLPQPSDALHGAALLRGMRLSRGGQFNRAESNQNGSNVWEAGPTRQLTRNFNTRPRANLSVGPATTSSGGTSAQDWFQETGAGSGMRTYDGVVSVTSPRRSRDALALPTNHQWRPLQLPRPQQSRTSASRRHSRLLSPPPTTTHAARRQALRENAVGAFPEPGHVEYGGSDDDSASSQEDLNIDQRLIDIHPTTFPIPASSPTRDFQHDLTEDTMHSSLDHPVAPTLLTDHRSAFRRSSVSALPKDSHPNLDQTSYDYEQDTPLDPPASLLPRGRNSSTHRPWARITDPVDMATFNSSLSQASDPTDQRIQMNNAILRLVQKIARNSASTPCVRPVETDEIQSTYSWSTFELSPLFSSLREPPFCRPRGSSCGWPVIPTEIYLEIARYLSREEALNLRLVCRDFSIAMMGAVFGSVVVPFGRAMYETKAQNWDRGPASSSMFEKYGLAIRKFGISFEADTDLIAKAQTKTISNEESSWWGNYSWPTPIYPRFHHLHILENLADNVSLLKSAMAHLGKTHELGLSIDSGHGWLNGPDISDMALFDTRCGKSTRVFGKNLSAEDKKKQASRAQFFKYAQSRTLEECVETLQVYSRLFGPECLAFLRSVAVRSLESFRSITLQPDFDTAAHTGGAVPSTSGAATNVGQHPNGGQQPVGGAHQPQNGVMNAGLHQPGTANPLQQPTFAQIYNNATMHPNQAQHNLGPLHPTGFPNGTFPPSLTQTNAAVPNLPPRERNGHWQTTRERDRTSGTTMKVSQKVLATQPQFPIIYNGYNLSAEVGGWCQLIQRKIASPKSFPLQPGTLTEAQAQWLMETAWAQRAFLSAYTTSVLTNKACFAQVNSLHIANISSGLLSSLEQRELWQGLPGLTTLTVLVSPDWRAEHITGDQSFNSNMPVSPVDASLQLSNFLKTYIAPLEKLSTLVTGFVGGGEHATGIMARNQHVLPAPFSSAPRTWLSDHITQPDPRTIITFNHIKHLTVKNAWFSPLMLEAFMTKSQDTSLRSLTLQSISLTTTHGQRLVAPLTTATEPLDPVHTPSMWLHESLPTTHCWPATIDRITPGATFLDRNYDAGMIADPYTNPRPAPSFRGFVSRLDFISCGYVRVSGVSIQEFNQNELVYPNSDPMDAGLKERAAVLAEKGVMLSDKNPSTGAEWPLLGKLTQCIHPIEKRVLEQAWGMKFGWGDDMERWGPVEDGCFEGGTGRFSGVIVGEGGKGIGADGT